MGRVKDGAGDCTRLLLRPQAGDSQAFAELYAALRPVVGGFAASLDRQLSPHDLEDLQEEVFMKVWRELGSFRGDASAKTFVLAIAKNVGLDELRHRRTAA